MTKEEFLREVRENLVGKLPQRAIDEIIYDYNEHFEAGLAEGRSEEQVSRELGSPAKLCRDIVEGEIPVASRPHQATSAIDAAPLGPRLIAFALDSFVAALPMALVSKAFIVLILAPFGPLQLLQATAFTRYSPPAIVAGVVALAFFALYQPVTLAMLNGQTPGKKLMGLRVVKKTGEPLTAGTAFGRELLGKTIINTVTLGAAPLISFVWAVLSGERRTVHDEIGGTRVIVVRR